jgi:hypothetical protein
VSDFGCSAIGSLVGVVSSASGSSAERLTVFGSGADAGVGDGLGCGTSPGAFDVDRLTIGYLFISFKIDCHVGVTVRYRMRRPITINNNEFVPATTRQILYFSSHQLTPAVVVADRRYPVAAIPARHHPSPASPEHSACYGIRLR